MLLWTDYAITYVKMVLGIIKLKSYLFKFRFIQYESLGALFIMIIKIADEK